MYLTGYSNCLIGFGEPLLPPCESLFIEKCLAWSLPTTGCAAPEPQRGHLFTHDCLVTDTFQLVFKDSGVNRTVGLLNTGIAWVSDKSVKFGNPSGMCYRNIFLAKLQQTESGCH